MARRGGLPSALFPFMSVLACTIGALVVLLAVMALAAVDTTRSARATESERAASLRAEQRRIEQEAARLEAALARWEEVDAALRAAGLEAGGDVDAIAARVRRAVREAAIDEALAEAEAEARRLAEARAEVRTTVEVLESRRETLPILIDPTGLSTRWQPFFIECEAEGITALRSRDDYRHFVPKEEIELSGDFARYLRRARAEPGALLVLLVRPDGLETAREVARLAKQSGQRAARLPLPGDGELDWRLLRRAESGT